MKTQLFYLKALAILVFDHSIHNIRPSLEISFSINKNTNPRLVLQGLIYFGSFHFTTRLIASDGTISYHDSKAMGDNCISEGHIKFMKKEDWQICKGRKLVISIYVKI